MGTILGSSLNHYLADWEFLLLSNLEALNRTSLLIIEFFILLTEPFLWLSFIIIID